MQKITSTVVFFLLTVHSLSAFKILQQGTAKDSIISENKLEILSPANDNVSFMYLTTKSFSADSQDSYSCSGLPTSIRFHSVVVEETFPKISIPRMTSFVAQFSSFYSRYYNSESGVNASNWLLSQVQETIAGSRYGAQVTVNRFLHHSWLQDSVIARIQGSENGTVILGAHLDSINHEENDGMAPGADDNASGSAAVLEAFRVLLESGIVPKKTVEFHWYAAEEGGLLGSKEIAGVYYKRNVEVVSLLNLDAIGGYSDTDAISIVTDNTDDGLNYFLRLIVEGYLTVNWTNSICGYECSDHVSWTANGFRASYPTPEVVTVPSWHTVRDTLDKVNFTQVHLYVKLALAFAIEMAEPHTMRYANAPCYKIIGNSEE